MHTAVFDIGKTNKKFYIFDENLSEIHREYTQFPETRDEEGFPTEDLPLLTEWMEATLQKAMLSGEFRISKLNFSTYGASFVHLDEHGKPVTPLYNYLKPFPEKLWKEFYESASNPDDFCVRTASPALGMLNSGLQLFWLQRKRPELFARIKHSLHFPQYCSYLFSGKLCSEYTSIGCHTGLWDFTTNDYHAWVKDCGLLSLLPPTVPGTYKTMVRIHGQLVEVGTGIHDSSAALLPYLAKANEPFLLLSTGTWNITFNPFSQDLLTYSELNNDCLNFMRMDGAPVKASRLFFGDEFNVQTSRMVEHFGGAQQNDHHAIRFNPKLFRKWSQATEPLFHWQSIQYPDHSIHSAPLTRWDLFLSFEDAYHRMMFELMHWQKRAIQLAAGSAPVKKLFVDGGFSQNNVFLHLLQWAFPACEVIVSTAPLGSSLGAAIAVNEPGKVETNHSTKNSVPS